MARKMTVIVPDSQHGWRVFRAQKMWAVTPKTGAVWEMIKAKALKRGHYWPVHSVHRTKAEAETAIFDAVANGEWPRGWLKAAPVVVTEEGVFT